MSDYSEYELVEQPAIRIFRTLGYEHQNCFHEKFGENSTLGRETKSEVVLEPKSELIKELEHAIQETRSFCEEKGIDFLQEIIEAEGLEKIGLLDDAVDAILVNEESKRKYLALAANVNKLYKKIC